MEEGRDIAEGRYRLVERLGAGGMAEVWRAWDARLRVWRAVKLLSDQHVASAGIVQRFDNEARTTARLRHPHLLAVHDVGWDGARPFLVMDLLPGGSLEDHRRRMGPFPPRAAALLVASVLDGLEMAHGEGVVHRDVKPHNVLIEASGSPVLADFGIARIADDRSNPTRTGMALGTLAYMAPEQRTHARSVDGRADIYAAGATLVALLTGDDPYDLHVDAALAEQLRDVPHALGAVITRATRWEPEQRYASAGEMAAALRSAAEGLPEEPPLDLSYPVERAPPPDTGATFADPGGSSKGETWVPEIPSATTPPESTPEPAAVRSSPWRWAALVAPLLAAGGGAAWALRPPSSALEPVDLSAFPRVPVLGSDGASLLGVVDGGIAEQPLGGGPITRWPLGDVVVEEVAPYGDGASVVALLADGSFARLGRDGTVSALDAEAVSSWPSPSGDQLLLARQEGLFVTGDTGVRQLMKLDGEESIPDVAWSADGARVLVGVNSVTARGREARVDLVDVASGQLVASAGIVDAAQIGSVAFVGSDRVWVGGMGTLGVALLWGIPVDAVGFGAPELLRTFAGRNDVRIEGVSDDRVLLVVERWERDVWLLEGREAAPVAAEFGRIELPGSFSGGELLYNWSRRTEAGLEMGLRRPGADADVPGGEGACWSAPAGPALVVFRLEEDRCWLERRDPEAEANAALFGVDAEPSGIPCPYVTCARDGHVCVTNDGTSMLRFDPATGKRQPLALASVPNGRPFDLDPEGRRLVMLRDDIVEVHPLEGGSPVAWPLPPGLVPRHVAWSADGERVWVAGSCELRRDCIGLLDAGGGFDVRYRVPVDMFVGIHIAVDERDRVGFARVHKVREGMLARP